MILEVTKEFKFSASHILPGHKGKCSRLHGHNWKLCVTLRGSVNEETGFVMDYAELDRLVSPMIEALDHRHLGQWFDPTGKRDNYIPTNEDFYNTSHAMSTLGSGFTMLQDFYPTSENILVWIAKEIHALPALQYLWWKLELKETDTCDAVLYRKDFMDDNANKIMEKHRGTS